MGIEYFLFALMLFGMVVIVFFLFFYGKRQGRRKEEAEWVEKNEKLMLLYFEIQDMLDTFKQDVENVQEWFEVQLGELDEKSKNIALERSEQKKKPIKKAPAPVQSEDKVTTLSDDVLKMYKDGMAEEDIAEKLKLSMNEVKFMVKLNSYQK